MTPCSRGSRGPFCPQRCRNSPGLCWLGWRAPGVLPAVPNGKGLLLPCAVPISLQHPCQCSWCRGGGIPVSSTRHGARFPAHTTGRLFTEGQ